MKLQSNFFYPLNGNAGVNNSNKKNSPKTLDLALESQYLQKIKHFKKSYGSS